MSLSKKIKQYEGILSHDVWGRSALLGMMADKMRQALNGLKNVPLNGSGVEGQHQAVYVVLFHNSGGDIAVWESQIRQIEHSVVGRPMYLSKSAADACITRHYQEGCAKLIVPSRSIVQNANQHYLHRLVQGQCEVDAFYWQGETYVFDGRKLRVLTSRYSD